MRRDTLGVLVLLLLCSSFALAADEAVSEEESGLPEMTAPKAVEEPAAEPVAGPEVVPEAGLVVEPAAEASIPELPALPEVSAEQKAEDAAKDKAAEEIKYPLDEKSVEPAEPKDELPQ